MENNSIARIVSGSGRVACEYYGHLNFTKPVIDRRITDDLADYRKAEPDEAWRLETRGDSINWTIWSPPARPAAAPSQVLLAATAERPSPSPAWNSQRP
jgi:hypothetical protein